MRLSRARIRSLTAALVAAITVASTGAATAYAETDTNFAAGTSDHTYLAGGEMLLQPTEGAEFDGGPALPDGWSSSQWSPPDGTSTVTGGALVVDGAAAGPTATYSAGRWLEFTATFGATPFQHVGFGVDFNNTQSWAMFSTGDNVSLPTGLYARTKTDASTSEEVTRLDDDPIDPLVPHRYRIVWTATGVTYYVDGTLVATHASTPSVALRPLVSDLTATGDVVSVDWLRMGPYAASGTLTSRVFDGTDDRTLWQTLTADADTPTGTSVALETRTGPTATPDGSWSAFQPVGAGGAIASPSGRRYAQYRVTLATTDPDITPVLHSVTIDHAVDSTAPTTTIDALTVTDTSAHVVFSSEPGATFQCSLDGAAFQACTSPRDYTGLAAGTHAVKVHATDAVGNVGVDAERGFTIAAPHQEPPASQPPPTTPTDSKAPKIRPLTRSATVSRAGKVKLALTCPDTETRCRITVKLRYLGKTIATKTITVNGDASRSATLKLKRSLRTRLAHKRKLTVHALTTARDLAGNVATTDTRIKLRAPK